MGKFSKKMQKKYKETNKKSIAVYLILRILVIISMIFQILSGNIENAAMCILSLFLFILHNTQQIFNRHTKRLTKSISQRY